MTDSNKRKEISGGDRDERGSKRSKGGSGGKWQTPHQKAKIASRGSGKIEPGDVGIWATCAKNMEGRATEELKVMFEECAERFYGIKPGSGEDAEDEDDIEASIQKELAALDNKSSTTKLFSPVHLEIPCVLFFKTGPAIEPVDFVHRICKEVVEKPGVRRMKYVNRLTPMTLMAKATEKGLQDLGSTVLHKHFHMAADATEEPTSAKEKDSEDIPNSSYAIRPTTRAHTAPLKRDLVIKSIADSISNVHKVQLTTPDKVILVEIFQSVCGMSVVGSDWEALKRFNLAELYHKDKVSKATAAAEPEEAKPQSAKKDEAP
ncbi:hypothetical protein IFR04_014768 [Cadophora malorum]|uniref:THUMP domain-containing protein n=1 Tax=Cadophora malorum TaxID=108018 RepID=A0A8H7W4L8_9HELO|nr:hypothetical protein IFR04_014768 [Cadophora malorum]